MCVEGIRGKEQQEEGKWIKQREITNKLRVTEECVYVGYKERASTERWIIRKMK